MRQQFGRDGVPGGEPFESDPGDAVDQANTATKTNPNSHSNDD